MAKESGKSEEVENGKGGRETEWRSEKLKGGERRGQKKRDKLKGGEKEREKKREI